MENLYFKPLYESGIDREPILEYNRIADCLLGGIVQGLMSLGYTREMAITFLSSKILRHELDGGLDDHIVSIGKHYGQTIAPTYLKDCEQWTSEASYE